jgi:Tat protein translocase TatB subunit
MFGIGWQELIIIAVVALIIVGPKKLPDLAKTLGKGIRDFKNATEGVTENLKDTLKEDDKPAAGNSLENTPLMKKTDSGETKNETPADEAGSKQNPA